MLPVNTLGYLHTKSIAAAALILALGAACSLAAAAESTPDDAESRMSLLEAAFWQCDYTATTRGVTATPLELCGAVYTAVRDEKFHGNFNDLLNWWRENKERQHRSLSEGREHAR